MKIHVIAIDFDGVIHDNEHPSPGRRMGLPMKGAAEALAVFESKGYSIVVFSIWAGDEHGKKIIGDWMNYFKLPFTRITNIKPDADYYIDNKGIHFTTWEEVLPQII